MVALVGPLGDELAGVASYELTGDGAAAEVAVADSMQRHGVATLLLEHLVSLARARGVKVLSAAVLAENYAVLHVLSTADLPGGPASLQDVTICCSDASAAMNPATVSQQGLSVFASEVTVKARRLHALCAACPHDPGMSGAVHSTVPVVFLIGTADPGNPPASVAAATATMPNALLVPVSGVGHWTLGWNPHPGCLLATTTTTFIQPASPAAWDAWTRALADQPLPFPALKPGDTGAP